LASIGFAAVAFVPSLKYPANPPAIGNPATIEIRTGAYFLMVAISIAATALCLQFSRRLTRRFGFWNGSLLVAAIVVVLVSVLARMLPVIDEGPAGFPADVLWNFRLASWGIQAVLWGLLGLLFGWLTERDRLWSRLSV
jgi:predicted cobalt transporter CbtA